MQTQPMMTDHHYHRPFLTGLDDLGINQATLLRHAGLEDEDDDLLVPTHPIPAANINCFKQSEGHFISAPISTSATFYSVPSQIPINNLKGNTHVRENEVLSSLNHNGNLGVARGLGATVGMADLMTINAADEKGCNNLFIANISNDVDDGLLTATFSPFGDILSAKVMLDIHTGRSRGFGFVMYASDSQGAAAIRALHNTPLGERGQRITVTKAQTSGQSAITETTKLYVRNIPMHIPEHILREHFSRYGSIKRFARKDDTAAKSATTQQTLARQQAVPAAMVLFLEYTTPQEAQTAVRQSHGSKPWDGMSIPLLAKTAETTENRNARRERQRQKQNVEPGPTTSAPNQQPYRIIDPNNNISNITPSNNHVSPQNVADSIHATNSLFARDQRATASGGGGAGAGGGAIFNPAISLMMSGSLEVHTAHDTSTCQGAQPPPYGAPTSLGGPLSSRDTSKLAPRQIDVAAVYGGGHAGVIGGNSNSADIGTPVMVPTASLGLGLTSLPQPLGIGGMSVNVNLNNASSHSMSFAPSPTNAGSSLAFGASAFSQQAQFIPSLQTPIGGFGYPAGSSLTVHQTFQQGPPENTQQIRALPNAFINVNDMSFVGGADYPTSNVSLYNAGSMPHVQSNSQQHQQQLYVLGSDGIMRQAPPQLGGGGGSQLPSPTHLQHTSMSAHTNSNFGVGGSFTPLRPSVSGCASMSQSSEAGGLMSGLGMVNSTVPPPQYPGGRINYGNNASSPTGVPYSFRQH